MGSMRSLNGRVSELVCRLNDFNALSGHGSHHDYLPR